MKSGSISAALIGALTWASAAQATVINFSDVIIPETLQQLTPGNSIPTHPYYPFETAGLKFEDLSWGYNGYLVSATAHVTEPNYYVPSQQDLWATWLHPTGGGKIYAADGGSFSLNSVNLNWWDYYWDAVVHPFTLTGEFADGSVKEIVGIIDPGTFIPFALNWSNLKTFTFSGEAGPTPQGGGFIGISGLDVTVGTTSQIPEPASLVLALAGLALAGVATRRRPA